MASVSDARWFDNSWEHNGQDWTLRSNNLSNRDKEVIKHGVQLQDLTRAAAEFEAACDALLEQTWAEGTDSSEEKR